MFTFNVNKQIQEATLVFIHIMIQFRIHPYGANTLDSKQCEPGIHCKTPIVFKPALDLYEARWRRQLWKKGRKSWQIILSKLLMLEWNGYTKISLNVMLCIKLTNILFLHKINSDCERFISSVRLYCMDCSLGYGGVGAQET